MLVTTLKRQLPKSDVWNNISAVKNNHVLEVDENLFYFRPMSLDKRAGCFCISNRAN